MHDYKRFMLTIKFLVSNVTLNNEADGATHNVPPEPSGRAGEADPLGALTLFLFCLFVWKTEYRITVSNITSWLLAATENSCCEAICQNENIDQANWLILRFT